MTKLCTTCGENKPDSDFYKLAASKDGLAYRCKSCDNIARKAYEDRHKERLAVSRKYNTVKYKYGLSKEQFDDLVKDGVCHICGKSPQYLCVDHCHSTGIIRGVLCQECNKGIGLLGDTVENLTRALEYLKNASIH